MNKKTSTPRNVLQILFVAITVLSLSLQSYAYMPEIASQSIPDAVEGSFYNVQLFAEGFGENSIWRAEGLPRGLEINPGTGVIFGVASSVGEFEIAVTVQKKSIKNKQTASGIIRLKVLPRTIDVTASAAPSETEAPQSAAQTTTDASSVIATSAPLAAASVIDWFEARPNGKSKLETTTEIHIELSQEIPELSAGIMVEDYIGVCHIGTMDLAADVVGIKRGQSLSGHVTYEISIENLDGSLKDGDKVEILIVNIHSSLTLLPSKMETEIYIESADYKKAVILRDALTVSDILGGNTSKDAILNNLSLAVSNTGDCVITWKSSNVGVISDSGVVTRPAHIEGDKAVKLTATISCNGETAEKEFQFVVKALPETVPEALPEPPPQTLPAIAPPTHSQNGMESGSGASASNFAPKTQTSPNLDNNGAVSRTIATIELKTALRAANGNNAVIKTQNALSISSKTLKALASEAENCGKQVVLHADTLAHGGSVDARLYLKPAQVPEFAGEMKLGVSTKNEKSEKTKRFFEKFFENEISVISCEQQGDFASRLQIAARIKLPKDTGNLVFYSYDSESNSFSRIITAYRIDANGYLRFATQKAGDIVVSDGALKRKAAAS